MINLRYHLVSIIAVFLALGIGITMGSTFLNKAAVDQIDKNVRNAREEVRQVKSENAALREQVARDEARSKEFTDDALARVFTDTLTDVPTVLLAAEGVDKSSLDDLKVAMTASGAAFDGTLTITDKFDLSGEDDVNQVAELLGITATTPARMQRALADAVAVELSAAAEPPAEPPAEPGEGTVVTNPDGSIATTTTEATTVPITPSTQPGQTQPTEPATTTTTTEPARREPSDLIGALIDEGYFDFQPALGGATEDELLTNRGYRYVIVTGPTADVSDVVFVRPLLRAMTTEAAAPVVVASASVGDEAEDLRGASIQPLIDDDQIGDRITTVDHLESLSGLMAVTLSIQDLGDDRQGHYGVGNDTSSQLPGPRG